MQEGISYQLKTRPRTRSFRYNISHTKTESNLLHSRHSFERKRNLTIINPNKLESVAKMRKGHLHQNTTLDSTDKKDSYLRTFMTFASKDFFKEKSENVQNVNQSAVIANFDREFEKRDSHFTFLDTMVKPVQYIEKVYSTSKSELKGQKFEVTVLRSQLNRIRLTTERSLTQLSTTITDKLKQMKRFIQSNEIAQQQRKLRFKKDIMLLRKGMAVNRSIQEAVLERNKQLQQKIFACCPFELEVRQIIDLQAGDEEE